jgi:hypothetical protein
MMGDNDAHEFESGEWVLYGSSYILSSTFRNNYMHNVINFHLISSDAPEIPVAINLGCGTLGNGVDGIWLRVFSPHHHMYFHTNQDHK